MSDERNLPALSLEQHVNDIQHRIYSFRLNEMHKIRAGLEWEFNQTCEAIDSLEAGQISTDDAKDVAGKAFSYLDEIIYENGRLMEAVAVAFQAMKDKLRSEMEARRGLEYDLQNPHLAKSELVLDLIKGIDSGFFYEQMQDVLQGEFLEQTELLSREIQQEIVTSFRDRG